MRKLLLLAILAMLILTGCSNSEKQVELTQEEKVTLAQLDILYDEYDKAIVTLLTTDNQIEIETAKLISKAVAERIYERIEKLSCEALEDSPELLDGYKIKRGCK